MDILLDSSSQQILQVTAKHNEVILDYAVFIYD